MGFGRDRGTQRAADGRAMTERFAQNAVGQVPGIVRPHSLEMAVLHQLTGNPLDLPAHAVEQRTAPRGGIF